MHAIITTVIAYINKQTQSINDDLNVDKMSKNLWKTIAATAMVAQFLMLPRLWIP